MNLPVSVFIAARYARASEGGRFIGFISMFSMAGIALGVMALIVAISVMDGFEGLLKERMLGAIPHVTVTPTEGQVMHLADVHASIQAVGLQDEVKQVLPLVQTQAIIQLPADLKGVLVQGVATQTTAPLSLQSAVANEDWANFLQHKYGILIGRYLALEYGLSVGDRVRLLVSGASHYTPIGRMPAQRNFTIVGMFETQSEIDQQLILSRSQDLNRLLKQSSEHIQAVRLVLNEPFDAPRISSLLSRNLDTQRYAVENWHKTHGKLFDAVRMEKNMIWFMLSLIIAVAAFNIVSALVMMVTKKQNEVAILKTQGMTSNTVAKIFTLQGAYNGVLGTLIGGVVGTTLTLNLNDIMAVTGIDLLGVPGVGLPIAFSATKAAVVMGSAFILAIVASVYPAKQAAKLKPADVLRYE